jgi:ERCC4-type nuclease
MLPSGDYSLEGLEDQVAIERKSEDDLIQSLVQRWPRFRAELERLQGYSFAAVVMETSIDRILAKSYTRSKIAPRALLGLIAGAMINHHPVHWYFAGDRIGGYHLTCELLKLMGERF